MSTYVAQFCKDIYKAAQDYVKDQLKKFDKVAEEPLVCLGPGGTQPFSIHFPVDGY